LQGNAVTSGLQGAQQLRVKAGDTAFQLLDMRHDLDQNKSMRRCNLLGLQGLKDVFPAGT
jgi:hypothetical protein